MMNSTSSVANQQKRLSRSNSTSSSVVTVKKAASLSSRSSSRKAQLKAHAASPEPFGPQLASIVSSSLARPSNSRSRSNSVAENKAGAVNANINRWSHSTTSSTSGIDNEQTWDRRTSPTRRMSVGPVHAAHSAATSKSQHVSEMELRSASRQSPNRSPGRVELPNPRLPPDPPWLNILPISSFNARSPATPSTGSPTPMTADVLSTPLTGPNDYFGETWTRRSPGKAQMGIASTKTGTVHYAITSTKSNEVTHLQHGGDDAVLMSPPWRQRLPEPSRPGHARHRDAPTKSSTDTAAGSSISSTRSEESRKRGHRSPTQKTMLSKALTKANTAVLLDNAQNFGGAMKAYVEACELLQQVMARSSDFDDRKKLSAICTTYSNRISELRDLEEPVARHSGKELPEMPPDEDAPDVYYEEDLPTMTSDHSRIVNGVAIPPRLESMLPPTLDDAAAGPRSTYWTDPSSPFRSSPARSKLTIQPDRLLQIGSDIMPPPLSPRRAPSPQSPQTLPSDSADTPVAESQPKVQHVRDGSSESTSWLDTIDESMSSASSSHLSSLDFRPSTSGNLVDEIEAEFDAALNAAVDAAYLDGPTSDAEQQRQIFDSSGVPHSSVYSKEDTTEAARPGSRDTTPLAMTSGSNEHHHSAGSYLDDEAEEEERLLDEMTKGYMFDDFNFDKRSKSALPRESDSSGFSGRTWGSSVASTTLTSGTTLSTLDEVVERTPKPKVPPALPPLDTALPLHPVPVADSKIPPVPLMSPPPKPNSRPPSLEKTSGPGVRDRRLSGQNAKQLKIETNRRTSTGSQSNRSQLPPVSLPTIHVPVLTEQAMPLLQLNSLTGPPSTSTLVTAPVTPLTSTHSGDSFASESPATSALTYGDSQGSIEEPGMLPGSPARLTSKAMAPPSTAIRKNMSSSSLKMRNLSVTTTEVADSPITPGSASLGKTFSGPVPPVPTPNGTNFTVTGQSFGGMYLFDDRIGTPNTPRTPRSPNVLLSSAPAPLERCPESFLLRPFWLMRCLYETIAHPRGGYVTTKLFIPRDVWRVKNVKVKAVEDKISQCDLLSAALLKIANVDNLDADAVLEELQSFETVMEQVRAFLHKKLGGEVGLSGSSSLFKGSPSSEGPPEPLDAKSSGTSNSAKNSFASSWRKLRSKSSGVAINATYTAVPTKDSGLSMPTLPMTTSSSPPSSRHAVRRVPPTAINLANMGANANYMGSLAKLFDAVQVIDQIARQVVDPGLKCSSQTLVGLELSVRNAADFFAFYVLRFVLTDVGVLLDKFVKRGSEWVLT